MSENLSKILVFTVIATIFLMFLSSPVTIAKTESTSVVIGFNGKPDLDVVRGYGAEIRHEYTTIDAVSAKVPTQAIEALSKNPKIDYIEEDGRLNATAETLSWGVDRIDAELVHPYNTGKEVKIAIIDTGVDYDHPDLDANYRGGYDFVNDDSDPMDDEGHGTHCAGIAAAEAGNGIGVVGVAPEASLYGVKVLDSSGGGSLSNVIRGIEWAVNNGMQIASMSLGTNTDYQSLQDACDSAYSSGVLLVAASGNDGDPPGKKDTVDYPAAYSSVIAVGATDKNDERAVWGGSGSSAGPDLELSAPGDKIYSTYWNDTYATASGTSMACPHVSGTAALVFASEIIDTYDIDGDGEWDADEVRQRLRDTSVDLGDSGWDPKYGYGLVDAYAAAPEPMEPVHDVAIDSVSAPSWAIQGDVVTVEVTASNPGDYEESFSVTLEDSTDAETIGSQSVTLSAGGSTTLSFSWDTTGESVGDHILEATADVVSGEEDTSNNSASTTVTVREPLHDVAVTSINAPDQVTEGDQANIDVDVTNNGTYDETFTVFLTDEDSGETIGTRDVNLPAGESSTLNYTWDTTGATLGDHSLKAEAVLETDEDNSNNIRYTTISVVEAQSLDVQVATDKSTYSPPDWANITATVTSNGSPVQEANVDLTVSYPDGATSETNSGTTDSNGVVTFRYRIGPKYPEGTYDVMVEATKSGYNAGSGSTTFSVASDK